MYTVYKIKKNSFIFLPTLPTSSNWSVCRMRPLLPNSRTKLDIITSKFSSLLKSNDSFDPAKCPSQPSALYLGWPFRGMISRLIRTAKSASEIKIYVSIETDKQNCILTCSINAYELIIDFNRGDWCQIGCQNDLVFDGLIYTTGYMRQFKIFNIIHWISKLPAWQNCPYHFYSYTCTIN